MSKSHLEGKCVLGFSLTFI